LKKEVLVHSENIIISTGEFAISQELIDIKAELFEAIKSVTWHSDKIFIINPVVKGNGVNPIKKNFIRYLHNEGWLPEKPMSLVKKMQPGNVDVVKNTRFGKFAVEWETGNISSSHRALNKMAIGIIQKNIIGGILIIPVRSFAKYLTDRIGNYEEIEPYIPMYQALNIFHGYLGIIVIVYDNLSTDAPLIPKGKDGNAKKEKPTKKVVQDLLFE
jgi:hypothetical protein